MKNTRRDLLKILPIAALVPSFASSKEELSEKLATCEGKYLIIVDIDSIDLSNLVEIFNSSCLGIYADIWPARNMDQPIMIFRFQ